MISLYQQQICTYIACDPQYYDEVNLNFISVINKYAMNLSSLVKTTANFTQAQLAAYLMSNKRYVDLLFYTEMILRGYITNLMMVYLSSYNLFMNNLYNSKINYISAMIALSALGFLALVFFARHVRNEQTMLIRINRIYRDPTG